MGNFRRIAYFLSILPCVALVLWPAAVSAAVNVGYTESFEGDTLPAPWTIPNGDTGWAVQVYNPSPVNPAPTDGDKFLQSNNLDGLEYASVTINDSFSRGKLVFDYRVDKDFPDVVTVEVDGIFYGEYHSNDWDTVEVSLSAGQHTITITYFNTDTFPTRTNHAYIDNVRFVATDPFASTFNNIIAVTNNQIHEFTLDGQPVRYTRMPKEFNSDSCCAVRDVVVTADRDVALVTREPLSRFVSVMDTSTENWSFFNNDSSWTSAAPGVAAAGNTVLVLNQQEGGILAFDAVNNSFLQLYRSTTSYNDITMGLDGLLYAMQADGTVHALNAGNIGGAVSKTLNIDGMALAVDHLGHVYSVDGTSIHHYDANGNLLDSHDTGYGDLIDIDVSEDGGTLVASSDRGHIVVTHTDFRAQNMFRANQRAERTFVTFTPVGTQDNDSDGLPDLWEAFYEVTTAGADDDGDGLSNLQEWNNHTHPQLADSDGDGLNDSAEGNAGTNPLWTDTDFDQVSDGDEVNTHQTDPLSSDSDNDQMPDAWEITYGLSPATNDSGGDNDTDGLTNLQEYNEGTHPLVDDTDEDGLTDGEEVNNHGTNPLNSDSDSDGLLDSQEVNQGLNPLVNDAANDDDNDGFNNLVEAFAGTDGDNPDDFPVPQPWSSYRGNAQHNGYLAIKTDAALMAERWSVVFSAVKPVSAGGGYIYAWVNGNGTNALQMLQANNGDVTRRIDTTDALNVTMPAYADGSIYYTVVDEDNSARLVGNNIMLFQTQFTSPYAAADNMTPALYNGTLYTAGTTGNGGVFALKAADGAMLWETAIGDTQNWTPAVNEDFVITHTGGQLEITRRTNGQPVTTIADPAECTPATSTTPVLGNYNSALVVSGGCLISFDLVNHEVLWHRSGDYALPPVVANGTVFAPVGRQVELIREFDGEKQILFWETDSQNITDLLATVDHLFVSTEFNTYALRTSDLVQEWTYEHGGELGLADGGLVIRSANLLSVVDLQGDTDEDGLPDWWEELHNLDPGNDADAGQDTDSDGLTNTQEFAAYSNPRIADTDGDLIPDDYENENGLDPGNPDDAGLDTDDDGLTNLEEFQHNTAADNPDTDGDHMPDDWEITHGFDPTTDDSTGDPDADDLTNLGEYQAGTDPHVADTDGDTMNDGWEVNGSLDPLSDDTDMDFDQDRLSNLEEFNAGTLPNLGDTDQDGLLDSTELESSQTDPTNPDSDGDGAKDGEEVSSLETDPNNPDTDGDGVVDGDDGAPLDPNASVAPQKSAGGSGKNGGGSLGSVLLVVSLLVMLGGRRRRYGRQRMF